MEKIFAINFYVKVIKSATDTFQVLGPCPFCTAKQQQRIWQAFAPVIPDSALADMSISYVKNCSDLEEIRDCINPTECDDRTEGEMGRSVFPASMFVVWPT
jgi:hypothetical protein